MIGINLLGKIAVVTGATGELGRTMVRTLAKAGADVAVAYHTNKTKANSLVDELKDMGRRAIAVKVDVTDEAEVLALRDCVEVNLGQAGIIVNNAVIQYKWMSILEQPLPDYKSQFESCVIQNVVMAKAFVPGMIKTKWGRIIALNTECSMQCSKNQSAYVSGKRGQDGIIRVLAREVGEHGITVNQVAPGWIVSENKAELETSQLYLDGIPLKRRGTDQEVANVVAFLASDLAAFISGAYIPVSGGNVMPAI